MKKVKWNQPHTIVIRVLLLPIAFILHLIPHIMGLTITMYRWLVYGGEFIVYNQDDKPSMAKIFDKLKQKEKEEVK